MRVLVCGGRDYDNREELYAVLDWIDCSWEGPGTFGPITVIISGHARGADSLAEQWAKDRLQIGGISNTATFVILDASIIETKLAKNNTLFDFIKLQASERYHLKIKAQIIIKNDNGQTLASSTSSASWSQTVREDASYVERQKIWFNMVEKSMKKFDEKMNEAITVYLGDYTL